MLGDVRGNARDTLCRAAFSTDDEASVAYPAHSAIGADDAVFDLVAPVLLVGKRRRDSLFVFGMQRGDPLRIRAHCGVDLDAENPLKRRRDEEHSMRLEIVGPKYLLNVFGDLPEALLRRYEHRIAVL